MSMPLKSSSKFVLSFCSKSFPMAKFPDGHTLIVKLIVPWSLLLITDQNAGIGKEKWLVGVTEDAI